MLLNLHKKKWTDGLTLKRFDTHSKTNEQTVQVSKFYGSFFNLRFVFFYCLFIVWERVLVIFSVLL